MGPLNLTFDLEDFPRLRRRGLGLGPADRARAIERGVDEFLAELPTDCRATFFTTGAIGRSRPALVRRLAGLGHEIGCHADEHEDLSQTDRADFRELLHRATASLEDASGKEVKGFRAPGFRLPEDRAWFFEELASRGYEYDSSVIESAPRTGKPAFDIIETPAGKIAEFPLFRIRLPFAPPIRALGGTYFRFLPLPVLRRVIAAAAANGFPPHIWLHAADLAPEAPACSFTEAASISLGSAARWPLEQFICRNGVSGARRKLRAVIADFSPSKGLRAQAKF